MGIGTLAGLWGESQVSNPSDHEGYTVKHANMPKNNNISMQNFKELVGNLQDS